MRPVEDDDGGYMPKLWAAEPRRRTILYELWVSAPGAAGRIGFDSACSITICNDLDRRGVDVAFVSKG
jgi:hypothetical protein